MVPLNELLTGVCLGIAISAAPDLPNLCILESGLSYSRKEAAKLALATLLTDNLIFLALSFITWYINVEWNPGTVLKQFSGLFLILFGISSMLNLKIVAFDSGGFWLGVIGSILNPLGYFPILLYMSSLIAIQDKAVAYLGNLLGTLIWFVFLIAFLFFFSRKITLTTRKNLSKVLSGVIVFVGVLFTLQS
ncbi:hypothetical protein GJ688_03755 [Heliobacillus mobilis]|uniref:Threonine/homoserine/homoserine lactone efflux protein n=1 Tax=Heliobacterium mobile TaxID=28064 RepID=A0A6I3SH04_HELMO|nr:hypothetical protein [Heliobacterium mobile]MTV48096.1 hypothetical protein [Heliobacterium mobile]